MSLYPDQAIFSKRPLRTVENFKGLKVRVHSVALGSLIAGLGGQPLTIPFAEAYTALERGTLDAGITGTKPGFGRRWYEVTKYIVGPISMRPHVALSINKSSWQRLPADIQKIPKEEAEQIVEAKTFTAIDVWNQEGLDKNVEKGMEHPEGLNLYIIQGIRKSVSEEAGLQAGTMIDLWIGVLPFMVGMASCLALIFTFPGIALWLPDTVMGK
jgi:TRAP-type C4-dicarboxylate transport system substrate-binding protein